MKSKILSLFIILSMVMCIVVVPVSAASTQSKDYTSDIEFLKAVGISDIAAEKANDVITRRDAVIMALGLFTSNYQGNAYNGEFSDVPANDTEAGKLSYAVANGLIAKTTDGRFLPDGKLKYIDALKFALNAIGYGPYISATGKGDSLYHKLSQDYDMNIKPANSASLTVGEFAHIVAKAADAPLMRVSSVKQGDMYYAINKDITVLTEYYDIYKVKGNVTQNNYTSLYESDALDVPGIKIDNLVINCAETVDTQSLLARTVTAYYNQKSNTLVYYAFEDETDVVVLECEDIEKYSNNSYYYFDGNKEKKYVCKKNAAVIYNGVAVTSADYNNFIKLYGYVPSNGFVELVKNDSSNVECIKITNYVTYVVQGVDVSGQKIVDKFGAPILDLEKTTNLYVCDITGEPVGFDYLDGMNILSVAESLNGYAAKVIVTAEAVEGALTSYDGEKIQLEGESFRVSQNFKNYLSKGKIKVPALGEETIIYFDARGLAAICELSPNTGWNYGYLTAKAVTQGIGKKFMVKMLTKSNGFEEFDSAPNIKIDGELIKKNPQKAYDTLTDAKLNVPVKYRVNVNGEIKEIDTPTVGSNETETSLKLIHESSSIQWVDYVSAFDGKYFMKSGAVCFTVPAALPGDERDYSVSTVEGSFVKDSKYTVSIYGEDPNDLVNTVAVKKIGSSSKSVEASSIIAVVDKVTKGIDSQGNEVWKVYAVYNGVMQTYTIEDNSVYNHYTDPDPLERGDVVRFSSNSRREVSAMERTFDAKTRQVATSIKGEYSTDKSLPHLYPADGDLNVMFHLAYGKTINLKNNVMQMQYNDSAKTVQNYYYMGRVVIVDKNEVRVGSVSDLVFDPSGAIASDILLEMRYLRVRTIVVYKN